MATQTIEFAAASGQTITAKLFASGSDTLVDSVSATEATNRKGVYTAAFTDLAAGLYRLVGTNPSNVPLCQWWVSTLAATGTYVAYEMPIKLQAGEVWDVLYSQHTTAGTFGKLLDTLRKSNYVTDGTVIAGSTPTTTTFRTDLTQPNDTYDHQTLLFLSGNLEGESKPILSYTQANGVIVLDEALTESPQIGDEFVILPIHVHPISIMTTAFQAGLATSTAQATAQADLDILTGTDGATISTDSITAIFSHLIENGVTFKQLLRAVAAIQVGEISNAGQSTETYKAIGNEGTTRVSAEVDEDGNRNNITLTL